MSACCLGHTTYHSARQVKRNIAITSGDFRFTLALSEAADDSRVMSQIVYTQELYAQSQRNTDMSKSECSDSDSESDWSGFLWHEDLPDQVNDEPRDSEQQLQEESDEEAINTSQVF